MNEIRTLFENFWICKDTDKETYYKVKRDIHNFQKFVRDQLGWKLIHTENLLKLEKKPEIGSRPMQSLLWGSENLRRFAITAFSVWY